MFAKSDPKVSRPSFDNVTILHLQLCISYGPDHFVCFKESRGENVSLIKTHALSCSENVSTSNCVLKMTQCWKK